MRKTRYWFDTEFIEDGETIDLISLGVVCDDGRELYVENSDARLDRASDWVRENVLPHLWSQQRDKSEANRWVRDGGTGGLLSRQLIRATLLQFVDVGRYPPEFWAYYADYDWVVLCQLFGKMIDLPRDWPKFCLDVKQLQYQLGTVLPQQESTEHHALEDARWTMQAWSACRRDDARSRSHVVDP